jgi:Raf kinase inhibitor-like YbhB/YbcL family protein
MNIFLAASFLLAAAAFGAASAHATATPGPRANASPFALSSVDIREGGVVPDQFVYDQNGCNGRNLSPALTWQDPPADTKSFAITMFDPDARGGKGWTHWAVLNIPAKENALLSGVGTPGHPLPAGAVALPNSWGDSVYGGPCPPPGDKPHHYVFTIYALPKETLSYDQSTDGWPLIDWLSQQSLAKASITATYQRPAR